MRFSFLALPLVLLSGCPSSPAPTPGSGPGCESLKASLKAATIDHQPTIAAVELKATGDGGCALTGTCVPTAGTACAEVTVTADLTATACEMTFTSTSGQTFAASATVKKTASSRCTVNGKSIQRYTYTFQPPAIVVDFDGRGDAGVDGDAGGADGDGGAEALDATDGEAPGDDVGEEVGVDADRDVAGDDASGDGDAA